MSRAEDTNVSIPHNSCVSGSLQSFGGGGKCTNKFRTRQNIHAVQKLYLLNHWDAKKVQLMCNRFRLTASHSCVSLLFLSEICSVSHNER